MTLPVSLRMNNAGAINTASWVRTMPGFVEARETTRGNRTASFRTPEQGVACWWELLRRYRTLNHVTTVGGIITQYGGTGQDYTDYVKSVTHDTGFNRSTVISLDNDRQLLALAKAMFAVEAGKAVWAAHGLTDTQIIDGFNQGRQHAGVAAPQDPQDPQATSGALALIKRILGFLWSLIRSR